MSRSGRNKFIRATRHLKSTQIDERLQMLNEIPTNSTNSIYTDLDVTPTPVEVDIQIPGDVSRAADFDQDDSGTDTTGLFDDDGTILTIEPPGDTSAILGPMISQWYAWGNFTRIGYVRESDRRVVTLATIDGEIADYNEGESGNSLKTGISNSLTQEQVEWFRDQDKRTYYAFYPGPPSGGSDGSGRYPGLIIATSKDVYSTGKRTDQRRDPVDIRQPWALPGLFGNLNTGTLAQLGSRLLRSFTDAARFSGDYMFKGIKAGVEYLPDFTGAAPKSLGGKKWADVFGPLGKALAGKNYASQYFTPSLNKALDYAKEGGTIVVMPRTGGVRGFKNWFGSSVSRGFGIGDIEKLVRTSDTIKSAQQGTTQIFNSADPKSMEALKKLAASGSKQIPC